jgi:hypothetical protein
LEKTPSAICLAVAQLEEVFKTHIDFSLIGEFFVNFKDRRLFKGLGKKWRASCQRSLIKLKVVFWIAWDKLNVDCAILESGKVSRLAQKPLNNDLRIGFTEVNDLGLLATILSVVYRSTTFGRRDLLLVRWSFICFMELSWPRERLLVERVAGI